MEKSSAHVHIQESEAPRRRRNWKVCNVQTKKKKKSEIVRERVLLFSDLGGGGESESLPKKFYKTMPRHTSARGEGSRRGEAKLWGIKRGR